MTCAGGSPMPQSMPHECPGHGLLYRQGSTMTEKTGGWTGQILIIDLTRRTTEIIPTKPFSERFVGGLGIAAKIAWDEIKPDIGAFDPGNKLIFSTGPLTGTLAPGSGRMEIFGKSPRTFPREVVTRSGMGGHWGSEFKYAGYDAVILEGEAEKPLYLVIDKTGLNSPRRVTSGKKIPSSPRKG